METKYLSSAGTFSKNPEMFGLGKDFYAVSTYLEQTSNIIINLDVKNRTKDVIDWISGLGANLYGHNHPGIIEAIESQVNKGLNFSIVHKLEYEVAELLVTKVGGRVPGWDSDNLQVRFMKTGTDACSAAVRLARAITNKTSILSFGYHGWSDAFVAGTPPAHGIPVDYKRNLIQSFKYGDKESLAVALQATRGNVAAIIVEHPPDTSVAEKEWYAHLREVCDEIGALLIVDEVVTGLRWGMGGVCEMYDIHPDIVCYGKALGGGLALSAVMAPQEYMSWFSRNDPVFVSSTQFGETLPLATAKYVLESWDEKKALYVWKMGKALMNGLRDNFNDHAYIYGHGCRSLFGFQHEAFRAFFIHGMMDRGILINRPNFATLAHTKEHVSDTIDAALDTKNKMDKLSLKEIEFLMKDAMPRILFRNR